MNRKIVKYCSETLKKMIIYYNVNNNLLLEINRDLKKILLINPINLYKIATYNNNSESDFFIALRDILFEKYIKTEIVRQWLSLFITNTAIHFEEIISAADYFNSKILEISVHLNNKIDLNNFRVSEIINFILENIKTDTINDNNFEYFIIYFTNDDKKNKEIKPKVFDRKYIDNLNKKDDSDSKISESDLLNMIFDYFIINKQREAL